MLIMDTASPLQLPTTYRSPSTRRRVPRSPTAETPRDEDLTMPSLDGTDIAHDAALIVALTSLSRSNSDMKTPGNEPPPTPSKQITDGDLTLTDLLRGTSASELQRMQMSASMDELPLLTPSMSKFPSMISTCSDILPKTPKPDPNIKQESDIQVIDPSLAPLDMERMESIPDDARGITAENVQHAQDDNDSEHDEITRAAQEILKQQSLQRQTSTTTQQDDDVNDELESQARPQYTKRRILPNNNDMEIIPMVRTTSNPDALPDEITALDSEESTVRAEQRVNELLERPDLIRSDTTMSMNMEEDKKMDMTSSPHIQSLESKFALLAQHMNHQHMIANKRPPPVIPLDVDMTSISNKRPPPVIPLDVVKRTRIDIGTGGKTGFQPVRGWQTPVTPVTPTAPPTYTTAASGIARLGTPHFPSHIMTSTTTTPPLVPIPLPTSATNLTTLSMSITASRAASTTSGATFSSTLSGSPSIFAPITLHTTSSQSSQQHDKVKKSVKKRKHESSSDDEQSQTSRSRSPSPHTLAQREAIIAQSSHAEGDYPCVECGKKFTTQARMMIHVRTHGGSKPFVCDQCGQQFNHKGSLTRHIRTHGGEKPYECSICHKRFFQTGNLTVHFRTHTGEKPFECTECGKRFNHRSSLTVHFRNHF